MPHSSPPRSDRLTADDWVAAALRTIAADGVGAVAVEPLAQRLGVTKGSFYWHFPTRDALLHAALARWEADTDAAIAALERLPDPGERLRRLGTDVVADALAVGRPGGSEAGSPRGVDLAIADAADDPLVRPVLRRVSERRLAYLEACFRGLGYGSGAARDRALLTYAAYVGTLRLARELPDRMPRGEEARSYRRHLIAALIPGAADDGPGNTASRAPTHREPRGDPPR